MSFYKRKKTFDLARSCVDEIVPLFILFEGDYCVSLLSSPILPFR